MQAEHYGVIAAVGAIGCVGQFSVTYAFRHGEVAVIAPLEYTALLWAIGIDFVGWQATPDLPMLAGAAIIIASGVYLVRAESRGTDATGEPVAEAELDHP